MSDTLEPLCWGLPYIHTICIHVQYRVVWVVYVLTYVCVLIVSWTVPRFWRSWRRSTMTPPSTPMHRCCKPLSCGSSPRLCWTSSRAGWRLQPRPSLFSWMAPREWRRESPGLRPVMPLHDQRRGRKMLIDRHLIRKMTACCPNLWWHWSSWNIWWYSYPTHCIVLYQESYSEYSLIRHNLFSKNMADYRVWRINWIIIRICTLYWYWEIVAD